MSIIIILGLIIFLIVYNRRCDNCNSISLRLYKTFVREDEDDTGHYEIWCKGCLSHLDYEYEEG